MSTKNTQVSKPNKKTTTTTKKTSGAKLTLYYVSSFYISYTDSCLGTIA